jgi:hypothetical protein
MALAPAPQPIGLFNEFIARQTETLVLKGEPQQKPLNTKAKFRC